MGIKISPLQFKKYLNGLLRLGKGSVSFFNDSVLAQVGGLPKRLALHAFRMDKRVDVALEDLRQGGTAPTVDTIGTSPAIRGYKFDATAETLQLCIPIPSDYTQGKIELHLVQVLFQSETDGDTIDWASDYIVVRDSRSSKANGEGGQVDGTSSSASGSTPVLDNNGNGLQAGTVYETVLEFDPNDGDNPFTRDDGHYLCADISRDSVGGSLNVGATLLLNAYLKYN